MKYKAIGFDYGGVIGGIRWGFNFDEQVCKILNIDTKTYHELYFSLNHLVNTGEVENWRDFWVLFLDKLGQPEKLKAMINVSNKAAKELEIIDPKMIKLVDSLRSKGYKTGLLTNTDKEGAEQKRSSGVTAHFDVFHASSETKLQKPNPEAFNLFCKELGVKSPELIFIDDAPKSLETAKECGFTPILFESYEKLLKQLADLGIPTS